MIKSIYLLSRPSHFIFIQFVDGFQDSGYGDDDEDIRLAIKLSLEDHSNSVNRQNQGNNSYSAAASKLTSSTSLPSLMSANSRNVYADPLKVISNSNQARISPGNRKRPIIVDGCNVAFQHGKNDRCVLQERHIFQSNNSDHI